MGTHDADPYDLHRFVDAQDPVYHQVLQELRQGRKTSHWMWFVFPQVLGLGHSSMAMRYAISGLDEARAYLTHAVLGPRLVECTNHVLRHQREGATNIFGSPDDKKFKSSMTLFDAAGGHEIFKNALDALFGGDRDGATINRL